MPARRFPPPWSVEEQPFSDRGHVAKPCPSVIVITERTGNFGPTWFRGVLQHGFVEYRGVRYAILLGTARQQWRVAIYGVPNQLPKERTVVGTREDAEIKAHSMIDAWLKEQRSALKKAEQ